jgi:hypothetical protein
MDGCRVRSKRGSSTAQTDCFAGAKQGKKRRSASVGMTDFLCLVEDRQVQVIATIQTRWILARLGECFEISGAIRELRNWERV